MFALSTYLLFLKELSEKKRNSFVLPIEAFSPYPHPLHPYSPAELGVVCCLVAQLCLCPTPCKPLYYSPPGSSVHGIPQARILEWVAISFSRGSSSPRDQTQVSRIAGLCFNLWATREAPWWLYLQKGKKKKVSPFEIKVNISSQR